MSQDTIDASTRLAQKLLRYVHEILTAPSAAPDALPEELKNLDMMEQVHNLLWSVRYLVLSLSNGELDYTCKEKGFVVGALKSLQANLRHLTWQAQQISKGDFSHRVNFLGDFSVAFNQMAEQLSDTIHDLTCISEEYKDRSLRDTLTGLYNRAGFSRFAEQILFQSACLHEPSTLLMADIDYFKRFNDTYGHLCGDEVLRTFASTILGVLRTTDLCARYGGEEFIILMPRTPLKTGALVAERLRAAIERMPIVCEGTSLHVTASFGLSEINDFDLDVSFEEQIASHIEIADSQLYCAKTMGRNRISFGNFERTSYAVAEHV